MTGARWIARPGTWHVSAIDLGKEPLNLPAMRGRQITGWRTGLLLAMLGMVALALVAPPVDLHDTSFHKAASPAIVKSRNTSSSAPVVVAAQPRLPSIDGTRAPRQFRRMLPARPIATPLPILHSALLC